MIEIMLLTSHPGGSTVLAAACHHCAVPHAGMVLGASHQHQGSSCGKGGFDIDLIIKTVDFVNRKWTKYRKI